ncbi:uncharacterized protein LOC128682316 isoform X2 [Plodia interpunctella]|nr:uncharacterized protein LOC128682316 isoform X2 [Plodia interpunctella]XP_053622936.1 uncharacterized protein LOC128682316 isoform X2 [Plodia interpunctella]XP_053622937.1 uncharacterized protein LOC128682316 isoform X2 [Plodia interpunctella]
MSSKNQPRQDPRIAPKEVIVTRRKSALQKRQLRDKDRSMRSITQLLKSPTRSSQSTKKQKLSPKPKSPKKKAQLSPDSVEGTITINESPKQVQRRPRVEKQRVWLKPKHNFKMVARTNKRKLGVPHKEVEPSRVALEPQSESLDSEGWLEVLTCASPVWWEPAPDHNYSEDAIYIRQPSPENKISYLQCTQTNFTHSKSYNDKQVDHKFTSKKQKLESILGCIKNRKNIEKDNDDDKSDNIDVDLINDEILSNLENIDIPIEPVMNANEVKIEQDDKINVPNEIVDEVDYNHTMKYVDSVVPENLPPLQRNPRHSNKNVTQNVISNDLHENYAALERNGMKINSVDDILDKSKDPDTISDTNIKFIDKVEDKELDDTSQMILEKIKKFFHEKERRSSRKEYITVYKIVDNEEKQEVKNDDQSKINYFYKKCKNVRKKSDNKTLALPNSEVKYCFKCSSIFETKECHYCAMTETRECVCDTMSRDCSCEVCDANSVHLKCSK